jgi:hypothetical protein
VISEIGADVTEYFPGDAHLASWPGLCPGTCESAGKRRKGNQHLQSILVECAWSAVRQDGYLKSLYHRHVMKWGGYRSQAAKKKAIVGAPRPATRWLPRTRPRQPGRVVPAEPRCGNWTAPAYGQYRASRNPAAAGTSPRFRSRHRRISSWRPAPPMRPGTPGVRSRSEQDGPRARADR